MILIEQKIISLSLELPIAAAPVANYVPYVITNKLVFISGQLPMQNGKLIYCGKIEEDISIEDGKKAAELCILNILAQLKAAAGTLDKVKRCIKLTGFVNSKSGFAAHPQIMNGASDLLEDF